jgi:hypothetical protein
MSWLSDLTRAVTGGYGVGETVGGAVAGFASGGNPAVIQTGMRIGGGLSQGLSDVTEGQATARSISAELPRETGMSGQQVPYLNIPVYPQGQPPVQAGLPSVLAPAFRFGQGLGQVIQRPGVAGGVGAVAGYAADFITDMFGNTKKLVITRKMQREVKELYMYMNADLNAVAAAYSQYKGMNFTAAMIQKILLKRFRNDGPYVTKAAIRKTRSTVRKLERLEMLKKQITGKPATTRRRATSTTRITQVK